MRQQISRCLACLLLVLFGCVVLAIRQPTRVGICVERTGLCGLRTLWSLPDVAYGLEVREFVAGDVKQRKVSECVEQAVVVQAVVFQVG